MSLPEIIAQSFLRQAEACKALGSPFTALVCTLLAERLERRGDFAERVYAWRGDADNDALALRAAGGLHALSRSGQCADLSAAYPPEVVAPDALWQAIEVALGGWGALLCDYLDRPPQTNEVARSNAILGGCLSIAAATRRPLALFEIGASAGLNLSLDQYRYELAAGRWGRPEAPVLIESRWEGEPPRLDVPLDIVSRAGCDLSPLDPALDRDRERLLSYVWPDQKDRLARIRSALDLAATRGWQVERMDAADWMEGRFGPPGRAEVTSVLFHTNVWAYLPSTTRERVKTIMRTAGKAATPAAPLAWFSVEPDTTAGSAAVRLTIWPPGETVSLGRADYHGRWTRWQRPAAVA